MSRYYVLNGYVPVPVADVRTWGEMFETKDRRVASDIVGDVNISTVFLGLDHSFSDDGPPLLFETMVFGGKHDGHCDRCSTWEQAEAQHARVVAMVQNPN